MNDLYILEIIENEKKQLKEEFLNDTITKGKTTKNKSIDVFSDEGIILIEETLPYIENIYRNANRIIINEEEIVKVELAKKITVESVKHLSKHTNFIQKITEDGDVEPSKILNINKEESYDTYENKLIYSLIQNINIYVKQKKDYLEKINKNCKHINDKKTEYMFNTDTEGKSVSINLNMNIDLTSEGIKKKIKTQMSRIKNIEKKLDNLTNSHVYKLFETRHIRPVVSPIKKTNLILKNVNFQYAVKLWYYLEENLLAEEKKGENVKEIEPKTALSKMLDEICLLYYIAIEKNDEEQTQEELNEAKKKFLNKTLEFLDLPNKEIEKVLLEKSKKVKKDELENSDIEKDIRNIFDKHFHEYLKQIQK